MHKNKVFIVWIFPYFFLCILSELYSWQVLLYVQVYLTWISFNFISTFYIDIFIAGICIIETGEVWGKDIITVYIFSSEMKKKTLSVFYVCIYIDNERVSECKNCLPKTWKSAKSVETKQVYKLFKKHPQTKIYSNIFSKIKIENLIIDKVNFNWDLWALLATVLALHFM